MKSKLSGAATASNENMLAEFNNQEVMVVVPMGCDDSQEVNVVIPRENLQEVAPRERVNVEEEEADLWI